MNRITTTLSLLALSTTFACGIEDPAATQVGEGVIGEGLSIEGPALPSEADELAALGRPDSPSLLAYCDDVVTWTSTWATFESEVLKLVNQKRAAGATCGGVRKPAVPAVTLDSKLRCAARKHSKDMGVNKFFSHTGSNGSSFSQRITSAGYTWTGAGENIAAGQTTPAAVVNSWMASTGHCNNIMSSTFRNLGVGYYYSATATYKHYWTQDFAKP